MVQQHEQIMTADTSREHLAIMEVLSLPTSVVWGHQ